MSLVVDCEFERAESLQLCSHSTLPDEMSLPVIPHTDDIREIVDIRRSSWPEIGHEVLRHATEQVSRFEELKAE